MKLKHFYDKVMDHPGLKGHDVNVEERFVVVRNRQSNYLHKLKVKDIIDHTWKNLERVLYGEKHPRPLEHITRIVGYYSAVENWNKSKLGELKDRQLGKKRGGYSCSSEQLKKEGEETK